MLDDDIEIALPSFLIVTQIGQNGGGYFQFTLDSLDINGLFRIVETYDEPANRRSSCRTPKSNHFCPF